MARFKSEAAGFPFEDSAGSSKDAFDRVGSILWIGLSVMSAVWLAGLVWLAKRKQPISEIKRNREVISETHTKDPAKSTPVMKVGNWTVFKLFSDVPLRKATWVIRRSSQLADRYYSA